MTITTLSSRELNQDVTRAKKATSKGPVIITDRGKPAHVLLRFEDYQKLTQQRRNIAEHWPCQAWQTLNLSRPAWALASNPPTCPDVPARHQCAV